MTRATLLQKMRRMDEAHAGAYLRFVLHYQVNGPVKMAVLRRMSPSMPDVLRIDPKLFRLDSSGFVHPTGIDEKHHVELYSEAFLRFWEVYAYPHDKQAAARLFGRLSKAEQDAATEYAKAYVEVTVTEGEGHPRRYPTTYLSKRTWTSPLPHPRTSTKRDPEQLFGEAMRHLSSE